MPQETRILTFDKDELKAAAYDYAVRSQLASGTERVLDLEVRPEAEGVVAVRLARKDENTRQLDLTYSQIAAALIVFCKQRHIPLPRYGDKRLSPAGSGITLTIRVDLRRIVREQRPGPL